MTLVNFLMFPFVRWLVSFERHLIATKEIPSSAIKLLISILLINGVIPIMMNADFGSNNEDNEDSKSVLDNLFAGSVKDFSYSWYKTSGLAFSMNFVLQMGFFWAVREPAMRVFASWRLKWTARARAKAVCGGCYCEKSACQCSADPVEESRQFRCSKEVLEKFLSTLMNSNWPESADRIAPTVPNYKRLLDGVVYQFTVDHPVTDRFMQSVESWEVSSFVRAEDCFSFVLALKSYIRTKGKHEEAAAASDAEAAPRNGSTYDQTDSLSDHSSCRATELSNQESSRAPASLPAEVVAPTHRGRDTRQLSELKMFVHTLVELGWPVPLGEMDMSAAVSSKDMRATLEGVVRRCCDDRRNFPGLQELVHGWWAGLPMEDHSRFTGMPALLRKEIRRTVNRAQLTQDERVQADEFDLASRWGKMLGTVYLSVMFSAGIPVLIYCACGFFALQMYADRYMLFNMVSAPNMVSQKDAERMVETAAARMHTPLRHRKLDAQFLAYSHCGTLTWDLIELSWAKAAAPPKYNPADRVGNMHGDILTPSVFGRDQQIHGVDKKEKADAHPAASATFGRGQELRPTPTSEKLPATRQRQILQIGQRVCDR
eukprot:CAMPEP_0114276804 /NCGR_PEP_ID=MMETSP0059-20121206/433_1 /TAXON_ID=36894 /ORGANISM="Pyramimonas parkeae, Strain CCMP726" /LENGTH=599 /DNA_ID=CAMNT_0001396829 /DNA_START=51 /DNA_END=1850 /DNA_ORIENTATION=-